MTQLNFENWGEFFSENLFTFFRTSQIQKRYIELIDKYIPEGGKALEIGAGSCYTTVVVADLVRNKNARVLYSDLSADLKNRAEQSFKSVSNLNYQIIDAEVIPYANFYFDVVFHQGFLEHFDDETIVKFLEEQGRVSKYIVFDVPNNRRTDKTQEFGNERFLPHKYWQDLVEDAGLFLHEVTARRFSNTWKNYVPHAFRETELFHSMFGESTIIVCGK